MLLRLSKCFSSTAAGTRDLGAGNAEAPRAEPHGHTCMRARLHARARATRKNKVMRTQHGIHCMAAAVLTAPILI